MPFSPYPGREGPGEGEHHSADSGGQGLLQTHPSVMSRRRMDRHVVLISHDAPTNLCGHSASFSVLKMQLYLSMIMVTLIYFIILKKELGGLRIQNKGKQSG